jgi:hypothetical protein
LKVRRGTAAHDLEHRCYRPLARSEDGAGEQDLYVLPHWSGKDGGKDANNTGECDWSPRSGGRWRASGAAPSATASCWCTWADRVPALHRSPPPHCMVCLPLKALIDNIQPHGWAPHARQPRMGLAAQGKEGVSQGWGFGAGRAKAKAGNHPDRVDSHQQVEAFIPPQTVTPADSGKPGQPTSPETLGIPCGDARAIQRFRQAVLSARIWTRCRKHTTRVS